jgi:hypothetical protein
MFLINNIIHLINLPVMNWYLAKIVYQIICGDGYHTAQFDEQLRLVSATNHLHAYNKASDIGIGEEDNFLNNVNKPVTWKFIGVAEIYPLDKLVDGAEMYSKIHEDDDASSYIRTVHLRAAHLLETATYQSPALN